MSAAQAAKERRALIRAGWEYRRGCPGIEASGWVKQERPEAWNKRILKALTSGKFEQIIFTRKEAYKKIKGSQP